MIVSNLFERCPKTGKIRGINRSAWPEWSLLFAGLAACIWYLFRVIPKPSRAEYPCQSAAAPIRIGFLTYCAALAGYAFSLTKARSLLRNKKRVLAGLCFVAAIVSLFVFIANDARPAFAANPTGTAKGIFPGRVAWVYNANAALWNGTGNYWDAAVNPQAEYNKSFTDGIAALSGGKNDADSWDKIFRWFNNSHGRPGTGYQAGDIIAIKINQNNTAAPAEDHGNAMNSNPQTSVAVVASLVNAGVPQADIWIGDPSRAVTDNVFNPIHNAFPKVSVVDYYGNNGLAFGCIRHTRYNPGGASVPFRFLIFEATAACGISSGRAVPSALYLGKFMGTIHIPMLGTVRSWGSTTQPVILNEPSSAMGIPWTLWVLSHQTLVIAETSIRTL